MKIGLKEISELSGFSVATVSNVLNNKKGVNAGTAKKILAIAQEAGYLKENAIDKVRLVFYQKHGSVLGKTQFFRELIEGIESECRSRSLPLEIAYLNPNDEDFSLMLKRIINDPSSATLLLATEMDSSDLAPFNNAVGQVTLLDGWILGTKYNTICINNEDALIDAVIGLTNLGYSDFGYLKSAVPISNFIAREEGFRSGIAKAGLSLREANIIPLKPNTNGAYKDMCSYLKTNPSLPKIFLADNDIIAFGAMKALQEFGYNIPKDIALVGFDDVDFCGFSNPTLTSIRVFKKEFGAYGVRILLDNINQNGKKSTMKVMVSTQFVHRNSI